MESKHSSKKKYSTYDEDIGEECREKKKHKKSKKSSKDKHKDRDKEKRADKNKEKPIFVEPELTAIEKFNMFKKQREKAKNGEGKVVDDLFKDFIASKIKQIENEGDNSSKDKKSKSKRGKMSDSVNELSKFLDNEISNIAKPADQIEKTKTPPSPSNPTTLGSLLKRDKIKESKMSETEKVTSKLKLPNDEITAANSKNKHVDLNIESKSVKGVISKDILHRPSQKDIILDNIPLPPSSVSEPSLVKEPPVPVDKLHVTESKLTINESGGESKSELETKSLPVFGPMLPRSVAVNDKKDDTEEGSVQVKKPTVGFKNFGIKLSATSAELILSGEVHKKGKRLEDGEVISSSSEGDSSDSELDADEGEVSGTGSISDTDEDGKSKKRKKKKKKGKHKKKKKAKDKDREKTDSGGLNEGKDKSGSKRKISTTTCSRSRSPKKTKKSKSRSHSRERSKRRSRSRSKDRSRSRRSRSRGRHSRSGRRSRSHSKGRRSHSRDRRSRSRSRRSRSRDRRSRSRSPDRFWRSKYGDFDAFKFLKGKHGRSRSKTPDNERDRFIEKERRRLEDLRVKIDKAKLREIAIQNAVTNARTYGTKLDVTIKAGGKSVEELTQYCKKIQEKEQEKRKFRCGSSSDEDTARLDSDDDIHHPFKVKEAGAIVMDIPNSKQLPVVTPQERLANNAQLRIQFPVSSGSQHRDKEWVPVQPEPPETKAKGAPVQANTVGGIPAIMPPPPKPEIKVFEEPPEMPVDIGAIVSERLTAVRKLQENPHDMSAQLVLSQAQKQASQWAASKNLPGKFLGSTGANIMSQEELMGDKKRQAWLKKDVFTNAAPVSGGIGMFLLQKMGWKMGEGLGKDNKGQKEPLMLDFKVDRKGLVTTGEGKKSTPKMPVVKDLSGKHPVSALGELCNKRRWGVPTYELVHESGPSHRKDFLFKVRVNNTDYQPSVASNNKKLAKSQAATVCLQELGLLPRADLAKT